MSSKALDGQPDSPTFPGEQVGYCRGTIEA
jgi:hypothetical protein